MERKEPLYRKVNTTARGVHHLKGLNTRWTRNTKSAKTDERMQGGMHQGKQRGLDYTPLFRFLLSRVGQDWDKVHSEAVARLDRPDPIFWMVAPRPEDRKRYFRCGEASFFSGLFVTEDNLLALVDPDLGPDGIMPFCACCTHTLNGNRLTRPYDPTVTIEDGGRNL